VTPRWSSWLPASLTQWQTRVPVALALALLQSAPVASESTLRASRR
jgi:hypothetical protein